MVLQGGLHWIAPTVLGLQGRIAAQALASHPLEMLGKGGAFHAAPTRCSYLAFVPNSVVTVCPVDWTVNVISYVAVLSLSEPVSRL